MKQEFNKPDPPGQIVAYSRCFLCSRLVKEGTPHTNCKD